MKEKKDNSSLPQDKDHHLDVPSEASRDNNINFLDIENPDNTRHQVDDETRERQKEWKEGLEQGKEENRRSRDQ